MRERLKAAFAGLLRLDRRRGRPGEELMSVGPIPRVDPVRLAVVLTVFFVILSALYIFISSRIAAHLARDVASLHTIEVVKGLGYVAVAGAALFLFSLAVFKRIAAYEREILRQRQTLLQAERQAFAGLLASSIGHDIKNIAFSVDLYMRGFAGAESGRLLQEMQEAGIDPFRHISALAERLTKAGQESLPGDFVDCDLQQLVLESTKLAKPHPAVAEASLSCASGPALIMHANPTVLMQMLVNLIINAAEAKRGGAIELRLSSGPDEAVIEVHDQGPGVPPAGRRKIFDLFHSSKGSGRGLGLLSVKAGAEIHGGRVEVEDSPLGGACFRIRLPRGSRRHAVHEA